MILTATAEWRTFLLQWRQDLALIAEQADRCKRIVSSLLDFARENKVLLQSVCIDEFVEKVLASMPVSDGSVKAERVLEINPAHPVFGVLSTLSTDDARVAKYANLLYDQALLIEGLPIEDPVAFSNAICELMV